MIEMSLIMWWLIAGWCGISWPGRKIPQRPSSKVYFTIVVGLIGAVTGGWIFSFVWPPAETSVYSVYVAVSGLPAVAGARILADIFQAVALGPQPIPPN